MIKGWNIETIKEYFNNKLKALSRALKLQAKEYKRRLKDLNGEAKRLRDIQEQYIPREVFDRVIGDLQEKVIKMQLWISNQEGKAARSQLIAIISVIVSIIAIGLSFFKK